MKSVLSDIVYMRPVLILVLVFYHAFAISNGGWDLPLGYQTNMIYEWLANYSYSFMLEAFTFISGFVFAFQCFGLNKKYTFWGLTKKKIQRLIIPSIVFGLLYVFLFYDLENLGKTIYEICWGGIGHLWYLPMLFWCFLMSWLLNRYIKRSSAKLVIVIVLALFSFVPLPFRMTSSMYYFLYFYIGQLCYQFSDKILKRVTGKQLAAGWIIYIFLFYVLFTVNRYLTEDYMSVSELYLRVLFLVSMNAVHIVYSAIGTLLFYLTANHYSSSHNVSDWVLKIGGYCFGIYIFQQFILKGLYYHTTLPQQIPSFVLPWIGFVIALIISYFLTSFMLRFKFGKKLIG